MTTERAGHYLIIASIMLIATGLAVISDKGDEHTPLLIGGTIVYGYALQQYVGTQEQITSKQIREKLRQEDEAAREQRELERLRRQYLPIELSPPKTRSIVVEPIPATCQPRMRRVRKLN